MYLLISGSRFGFKFITVITIGVSVHSSKIVFYIFAPRSFIISLGSLCETVGIKDSPRVRRSFWSLSNCRFEKLAMLPSAQARQSVMVHLWQSCGPAFLQSLKDFLGPMMVSVLSDRLDSWVQPNGTCEGSSAVPV